MNLEDRFRDLRPRGPAEGLRARVLAAARGARREQRLWRWTWAVAGAVLAIAIPVNLALDTPSMKPSPAPLPDFIEAADESVQRRWRTASSTPRPRPFPREVTQ